MLNQMIRDDFWVLNAMNPTKGKLDSICGSFILVALREKGGGERERERERERLGQILICFSNSSW